MYRIRTDGGPFLEFLLKQKELTEICLGGLFDKNTIGVAVHDCVLILISFPFTSLVQL